MKERPCRAHRTIAGSQRATIGHGCINPTVKLRLPRGKARQIAWMSTVSGHHDQFASLHIPDETGVRVKKSSLFTLVRSLFGSLMTDSMIPRFYIKRVLYTPIQYIAQICYITLCQMRFVILNFISD